MALALRRHVLEEEETGFPSDDYFLIAVAINIHNDDLHSCASARAVVQDMPLPLHGAVHHDSLVPIDSQRLVRTWIMVVRVVAFARD